MRRLSRDDRRISFSNVKQIKLSPRQLQVLADVARGYRDKEIADRLGISIFTVRDHAARAAEKLGASNRENMVWLGRHFVEQKTPPVKAGLNVRQV